MDAYDEGSNASHGPSAPDGSPVENSPADSSPADGSSVDNSSHDSSPTDSDSSAFGRPAQGGSVSDGPAHGGSDPDSDASSGSDSDGPAPTGSDSGSPEHGGPEPEAIPPTGGDADPGTDDALGLGGSQQPGGRATDSREPDSYDPVSRAPVSYDPVSRASVSSDPVSYAPVSYGPDPYASQHQPSTADSPYPPHPPAPPPDQPPAQRSGIAALSLPYQVAAALVLAVVAVTACAHLAMVFLHVAPSNTVTKQHGRAIDEWVYPEFEQNWKLFAPNPLQQNIAVQVRAEVRTAGGGIRTTGWYDLSALDGAAIDGGLLPSHTQQNELRRAWDYYVATHDGENRPVGQRGDLSERYLRRIVVMRLEREGASGPGGVVERVQVRSRTTNVPPPEWSEEQVSDKAVVRELPWWSVTGRDRTEVGA